MAKKKTTRKRKVYYKKKTAKKAAKKMRGTQRLVKKGKVYKLKTTKKR